MSHGRSPHGECGLKCLFVVLALTALRRSPHGECGLKSIADVPKKSQVKSLPAWGVWIEIPKKGCTYPLVKVAPRMGSVD